MLSNYLLLAVLIGIALLLFLILRLKLHAFLALLTSSIVVGLLAGLDATAIIQTIREGMGGTLGFVATVVGLGALFGAILEASGGAQAIASFLIRRFGLERAPVATLIAGFLIAIPVFFDVAFIILVPMIYALQRRTGKSLLLYAIPLLAGLAITHAFIPPTPGPIAVADIIGAPLGWVILMGFLVGIPTALVSGLWFARYIANRIQVEAPQQIDAPTTLGLPPIGTTLLLVATPILLILLNTVLVDPNQEHFTNWESTLLLLGHPFSALLIANFLAWYLLGIRRGFTRTELLRISHKSFEPAGTIILLTGAGGVFKQVLTTTGAGALLATTLSNAGIPVLAFAFISAAIVRLVQGSATVAMITAAGLVAPLLVSAGLTAPQLGCIVIAIASGASIFSHVNDSGFWLVGQYLGINEQQTLRSWTVMTTLLALSGMLGASLCYWLL